MHVGTIYKISHASSHTKGFAWAAGFGPLPDMPFLNQAQRAAMDRFWNVNPMKPGLIIDPGAKSWPDFLGHGGGSPSFFISERVLRALLDTNCAVSRATEVPIAEVNAKALHDRPVPKYYVAETHPGIEVDFAASNIPTDGQGQPVLKPLPKPWPPKIKLRGSSWDGSCLFDYGNFGHGPHLNMLCTERVKELAEKEGWTNVCFKPMELV